MGAFAGLPGATVAAAADLAGGGPVQPANWDALAAAVGPGPLAAAVAEAREQAH